MHRRMALLAVTALLLTTISTLHAQDWADLKGQFLFDGKIPDRKELHVSEGDKRAAKLPADYQVLDESLVIDEKTKGIANILIWAIPDPEKPDAKMPIHPDLAIAPGEHSIQIKNFAFVPHVSVIRSDQQLNMKNEELIGHNIKIDNSPFGGYNFSLPSKEKVAFPLLKQTRLPTPLSDSIAPYLKGWLVVRDNPYFAVTNDQGLFEMKNLPVGEWRFKAWHEKSGWITEVTIGKLKSNWPKGEFKVKLDKFDSFLGAVELSEKLFDK